MNWTEVDSNARCDKTRQSSFFFPNEKERKFARKRGGGEKEMGGWWGGGVGVRWCLTFFQRYYKLSECSCSSMIFIKPESEREREERKDGVVEYHYGKLQYPHHINLYC